MKTMRTFTLSFVALMLFGPILAAQDLSKYRSFTIGASLTNILKQTNQTPVNVRSLHQEPALLQEVTWWPPTLPGNSRRPDAVQQIVFSFQDGELYKMSITYDRDAVEGFTAADMVQYLAAKYGKPTQMNEEASGPDADRFDFKPKPLAIWEDADHVINLVRTSYSEGFGLEFFSKIQRDRAEVAMADAVKLEEQQRPQKEADQRQKQADDLEIARQKNKKSFQP